MDSTVWLILVTILCAITLASSRSISEESNLFPQTINTGSETALTQKIGARGAPAKKDYSLSHVLRIGAFNIKTFGRAKMSDPEIASIITEIVLRYDVILIQEIRDSSGESVVQLWSMVNRTRPYGLSISDRLGRTSYKEQYAYFYRLDRLALIDSRQYNDDDADVFEREPYSIRLRPIGTGTNWDLALIGIHAKPDAAVSEIMELIEVYDDLVKTWPDVRDIIIMGDFNADCSYAKERDLEGLPIYNQFIFDWLLGFDADTTTSTSTDCAYDRFVVSGPNLASAVIPGSAGIYTFEDIFHLDYQRMRDVSDHYPIEFEIY